VCQGPRALTQRSSRLGQPHGCAASNPRGALAGGPPPARSPDLQLYAAVSSSPPQGRRQMAFSSRPHHVPITPPPQRRGTVTARTASQGRPLGRASIEGTKRGSGGGGGRAVWGGRGVECGALPEGPAPLYICVVYYITLNVIIQIYILTLYRYTCLHLYWLSAARGSCTCPNESHMSV
jgi:hypothetical protein